MICGTCGERYETFMEIKKHWRETGCNWHRRVWERATESKRRGHSGRRILSEAMPQTFPPRPMTEETKERLRELGERRVKPKRRRRR